MMNITDKVSIIIPVYRSKQYLTQCMESILNQTYKNIEIILIDDGSDDGSFQLCNNYELKFNNVSCIHQKNKGVSSARNVGIMNATGKYILFVDSDDYISSDYIEKAMDEFSNADIDLYLCGYQSIRKNGKITEKKYYPSIKDGKWNHANVGNIIIGLFKTTTLHAIGTKIYKKAIIEQYCIRFKETWKYYEDIYFCLSYLYRCRKIHVQNDILYFYRKDVDNSLSTQKNCMHYKNIFKTYNLLIKFIKTSNENIRNEELFYEMYLEDINRYISSKIAEEKHYTITLHRLFDILSKDKVFRTALSNTRKVEWLCFSNRLYFITYLIYRLKFCL